MQPVPSPTDPIENDEGILRRVSTKVWAADASALPPVRCFYPQTPIPKSGHPGDIDGLSVSRERITPAEQLSHGPLGKRYHVAQVKADVIRGAGVAIRPDPKDEDRGHCLLPEINIVAYQSDPVRKRWIKERAEIIARSARLVLRVG